MANVAAAFVVLTPLDGVVSDVGSFSGTRLALVDAGGRVVVPCRVCGGVCGGGGGGGGGV